MQQFIQLQNYSSMHGWLQKIKNGNYNLNCSGGEYMSSNTIIGVLVSFTNQRTFLTDSLPKLFRSPFFAQKIVLSSLVIINLTKQPQIK